MKSSFKSRAIVKSNELDVSDSGTDFQLRETWTLRRRDVYVLLVILVWSCAMSIWGFYRGVRHDYVAYLDQWILVLDNANPWSGSNTYGPLHNVLAFLTIPSQLGPKIFMFIAFVVVNFLLIMSLLSTRPSMKNLVAYVVLVPANFLVIGIVFSYGLNDGLTAAIIGLAILARFRRLFIWSGILLGLAVLLKYYPALLIPFFCLNDRRFNLRLFLAGVCAVAVGFFVTWLLWGTAFITSFSTGAFRGPKLLSVISSLERNQTFGPNSEVLNLLVTTNALVIIMACGLAYLFAFQMRYSWIEGATFALFITLLLYKVGHQQFYVSHLILIVGLLILGTNRANVMAFMMLPYMIFLSMFQIGYEFLTDQYNLIGGIVRDDVGFFAFVFGFVTVTLIIFMSIRRQSTDGKKIVPNQLPPEKTLWNE